MADEGLKAVILAGGLGTRLAEETDTRPKPMVKIGERPILWHIMKIYTAHGIRDFVICVGYKGYLIKEYFSTYFVRYSDVTFDYRQGTTEVHGRHPEPWRVTLVETGDETMTGGRIRRIRDWIGDDELFCLTYGDGVADIDVGASIALHRKAGRLATLTAVRPPGRFGAIWTDGDRVTAFREKPDGDGGWVNGGFYVLSPKVIGYIAGDQTVWEHEPLERLAAEGQLSVYYHHGFWQPMDTLRDRVYLEQLWRSGDPPWRIWDSRP